jgi:hypothetical protein
MKKRYHWLRQSQYLPPLSRACEMCAKGSKLVVLITGLCPARCFYCPLSKRKQHNDVVFADEWQLENKQDVETLITESQLIDATGAGITGGDPLLVPQRTVDYINLLKQTFGKKFHIHLYTSGLKNTHSIPEMVDAGLDEIRFHPEPKHWMNMKKSQLQQVISEVKKLPVDIAIEIPVIPKKTKEIIALINWADELNIDFINLNELEFSEQNETGLYEQGFSMKNELSAAAKGSQDTAYKILQYFETQSVSIGIHYCSSSFKDAVQLTNRMKRRAKNIATNHDLITDEGTLLKGIIEPTQDQDVLIIKTILEKKLNIHRNQYSINQEKNRIELHPHLLDQYKSEFDKLQFQCFIIEEYPTADHLEVERIPLN